MFRTGSFGTIDNGRSLIERSLVLGLGLLLLGYAAGCGGSPPADTTQTPATGSDPAAPAAQTGAEALGDSSITGSVTFTGNPPTLPPVTMNADPACAKKHSGPVENPMLVLGEGNTMGNIMVWVSDGLPEGKTWPPPASPAVLDQDGCQYEPHVMGVMVGQQYRILNSDGILHNVHTLPKINRGFNKPMPATMKETTTTFEKPEQVFQIKCDVHPWMSAYVGVFKHPFFSVTDKDGKFTLEGLAPGTYTLTAWHERLGEQKASVTVGDDETKTQNFTFGAPGAN